VKAPRGPKPSRTKLNRAEDALDALEKKHAKALSRIDQEQRQLERKRHELELKHAEERTTAKQQIEEEQERYSSAVRAWENGG
jgi:hypothetical protein